MPTKSRFSLFSRRATPSPSAVENGRAVPHGNEPRSTPPIGIVEPNIKEVRHRLLIQVFRQWAKGRVQAALIGAKQIEALALLERENEPERSVFAAVAAVAGGEPEEIQLAFGGQRVPKRFMPSMANITSIRAEETDLFKKYGIFPAHEDYGILVCLAEHESLKPSRELLRHCGFSRAETAHVIGVSWLELFG